MRRFLLITLSLAAALSLIVIGAAAWMLHDEAFLRSQLSRITLEQTGRELRIEQPLMLSLGRMTTLETGGIALANADWAENPEMARIGRLKLTLDVASLFGGPLHLAELELEDCALELLRNDDGEPNWSLTASEETPEDPDGPAALPRIDRLAIDACRLALDGPERSRALQIVVAEARLARTAGARVEGRVDGSFDGESLAVRGWLEPVSAFRDGGRLQHELAFRAGQATLESAGSVADALTLAGPDIRTRFSGPDIGRILEQYGLPPLSEGAFDFRATLATRDGRAVVDIDGDLGSLDVSAKGELDRLLQPRSGHIRNAARGGDLRAVGLALGVDLPVPDAFEWMADFEFGPERVDVTEARLETARETLALSGVVSTRPGLAGSDLDLAFESAEIGRWLPLAGRPRQAVGPATVVAAARVDDAGVLNIDARARQAETSLEVRGDIGPLRGPYEPELEIRFESPEAPRLAAAIGLDAFPASPLRLSGHVRRDGRKLNIRGFEAWLGPHHAVADGTIVLDRSLEGSELTASLEIPDLAEFGALFGHHGLPGDAVRLDARLRREGPGLVFDIGKAEMDRIRLSLEGRIADLAQPAGIDARFDLRMPGSAALEPWLPGIELPSGALQARGALVHRDDRTHLDGVEVTLGDIELEATGHFTPTRDFDLRLHASGPDLSALSGLARTPLPSGPFEAATILAGAPDALEFRELEVRVGRSEAHGSLSVFRGEVTRLEADLAASYLNLNFWLKPGEKEDPPNPPGRYLFDDTPILSTVDPGLEIDAKLRIDELDVGFGQYTDLDTRIVVGSGRIAVDPFSVEGFNEGLVSGWLRLDAGGPAPTLDLELAGRESRLAFAAAEGQDPHTLPKGDFRIELHGQGHTRREMAGSIDGRFRANFGAGQLKLLGSGLLVSDFFTELVRTLNPWSKNQEFTELECAVVAIDIDSGRAAVGPVVFNARRVTILTQGTIDLETERIDLAFNSMQRTGLGISAADLVNPFIKVGGTLAGPSLELDPAGTVVKGGLAVVTGGLSILANSLAERYLSSKDPCGDALRELEKRDSASP